MYAMQLTHGGNILENHSMNSFRLYASVVSDQVPLFLSNGWCESNSDKLNPGFVIVSKAITTNSTVHVRDNFLPPLRPLFLIQRGTINRPLGKYEGMPLTGAVDFDYMGSAEFHFGGTFHSLLRVRETFFSYHIKRLESITVTEDNRVYALRLYTRMTDKVLAEYVEKLVTLRNGALRLKENSGFTKCDFIGRPTRTDFWWDIENDTFFSFDKNFMNRLPEHLTASFKKMYEVDGDT